MKFSKLTKKLLLSALSLGLAVVTLTTTTYAWYTTNTEASATGEGSTSGSTDDYSLMISSDQTEWGQTATITADSDLVPLQWDATEKRFEKYGASEGANSGYYQFTLYFKTSGANTAKDVYLKNINIVNKEADATKLTKFDNLSNGVEGCPTTTYAVDMVKALDLVIGTGENAVAYELSNKFTYLADQGTWNGTPNALTYYNDIMTTDLVGSETASLQVLSYAASLGQIPVGGQLAVTFTVYLNGWDAYCFDACRGQSFSISLEFSTNQPAA